MSELSKIQRGVSNKPPRILIYGVEGIGKTSFAARAPRPIFVPTEDGLDGIDCDRFPLAETYEQVVTHLQSLLIDDHSYQSVVLDSLDWLERLIGDRSAADLGVRNIDQVGFGKGHTHALSYWRQVVQLLGQLREQRGMAVILVAHSCVVRTDDPLCPSYDRYSPRLHKHAAALVTEWVDAVLLACWRFRVQSEDTGFGRERSIAVPIGAPGEDRVLKCVGSPAWVAKNRFGLPAEISLDWGAFIACLSTVQSTGAAGPA
ncbi:MAG: ATP-binding protein [Pirellulales bacterium]